jgi:hypothetical protein
MIISVLPQIETEGIDSSQINELIQATRDKMVEEYERISQLVCKKNQSISAHRNEEDPDTFQEKIK